MKIFLYGLRGSGKSTIGEELGKQTDEPLYDLDTIILKGLQEEYGEKMTISKFVEEVCFGNWQGFRDREHQSLRNLQSNNTLIALGGGTIAYDRNRHIIDPVDNYNLFGAHHNKEAYQGAVERIFNRERLPKISTRVFLNVSSEEQRKRLRDDTKGQQHRPDLGEDLENIYNQRIGEYTRFADIQVEVDVKSVEEIVREILGYSEISDHLEKQGNLFSSNGKNNFKK